MAGEQGGSPAPGAPTQSRGGSGSNSSSADCSSCSGLDVFCRLRPTCIAEWIGGLSGFVLAGVFGLLWLALAIKAPHLAFAPCRAGATGVAACGRACSSRQAPGSAAPVSAAHGSSAPVPTATPATAPAPMPSPSGVAKGVAGASSTAVQRGDSDPEAPPSPPQPGGALAARDVEPRVQPHRRDSALLAVMVGMQQALAALVATHHGRPEAAGPATSAAAADAAVLGRPPLHPSAGRRSRGGSEAGIGTMAATATSAPAASSRRHSRSGGAGARYHLNADEVPPPTPVTNPLHRSVMAREMAAVAAAGAVVPRAHEAQLQHLRHAVVTAVMAHRPTTSHAPTLASGGGTGADSAAPSRWIVGAHSGIRAAAPATPPDPRVRGTWR